MDDEKGGTHDNVKSKRSWSGRIAVRRRKLWPRKDKQSETFAMCLRELAETYLLYSTSLRLNSDLRLVLSTTDRLNETIAYKRPAVANTVVSI